MQLDIRYPIVFISILILLGGLYFKFLDDVPDGQEVTNMNVSFILVVIGIIGIMFSSIWKKKNPMQVDSGGYIKNEDDSVDSNTSTSNRNLKHSKREMEGP